MISRRTKAFKELLDALPPDVQRQAREAFRLWMSDPRHPSLHFKKIHSTRDVWSARVTQSYRALCVLEDDTAIWTWIGPHAEYERLLRKL